MGRSMNWALSLAGAPQRAVAIQLDCFVAALLAMTPSGYDIVYTAVDSDGTAVDGTPIWNAVRSLVRNQD